MAGRGVKMGECDDKPLADLYEAERGSEVRQLLQHYFEVNPRNEDLDITANAAPDGAGAPAGRKLVANGATERIRIAVKPGLVLYIGRIAVRRADGSLDLSSTTVSVRKGGLKVGFIPESRYERRIFLDRDDTLEIAITNASGGDLTYEYSVDGFARRAGIPVMQPDRSGGRS